MDVLLVLPDWGDFPLIYRRWIATLGLPTLCAEPADGVRLHLVDGRIEEVDTNVSPDLVAISAMTCQAGAAYRIADAFRSRAIPVVLGGPHATAVAAEALDHTDAVVVGEGEGSWGKLLADFRRGEMQRIYACPTRPDLGRSRPPDRSLHAGKGYLPMAPVQVLRGCPMGCKFCSVPEVFGPAVRHRPVDEVVAEIAGLDDLLFFVDDYLTQDKAYATELFTRMIPLGKRWSCMAPLTLGVDEAMLSLMAKSGCWLVYIDVGPWIAQALGAGGRKQRTVERSLEMARRFSDHGVKRIASIVFGFDYDTEGIFDQSLEFATRARFEEVEFLILTPYPNTSLHRKLTAEGRILETDWAYYTTTNVVHRPALMTPERLAEGYRHAWREYYRGAPNVSFDGDRVIVSGTAAFPEAYTGLAVDASRVPRMGTAPARDGRSPHERNGPGGPEGGAGSR